MSFMEKIFGARQAQPTGTPVNPNVQQVSNDPAKNPPPQGTAQSAQTAANGVVPAGGAEAPPAPLEQFKDLWKPTPVDPAIAAAAQQNAVDPAKLMEAAGKIDFAKVISQEDLAKITAGGADAAAVFAQAMNKVAQTVYGQSAYATTKIVEQAVQNAKEDFASQVPGLVQARASKELLASKTQAFKNPAVAPIVEAIHKQLVEKYPNASSEEILTMAQDMMKGAAQVFNPESGEAGKAAKAPAGTDWESWINTPVPQISQ